jgi:hypothetical protein
MIKSNAWLFFLAILTVTAACIKIDLDKREILTFNRQDGSLQLGVNDKIPMELLSDSSLILGGTNSSGQMLLIDMFVNDTNLFIRKQKSDFGKGLVQAIHPIGDDVRVVGGYSSTNSYLVWFDREWGVQRKDSLFNKFRTKDLLAKSVVLHDLVLTDDSFYMICGSYQQTLGERRMMLAKLAEDGELLWYKTYDSQVSAYQLEILPEGDMALAAKTEDNRFLVYMVDSEGVIEWKREIPQAYALPVPAIALAYDGGVVALATRVSGSGEELLLFAHYQNDGAYAERLLGAENGLLLRGRAAAITPVRKRTYAVLGTGPSLGNYIAARIDENGQTLWSQEYLSDFPSRPLACHQVFDQGFVIAGVDISDDTKGFVRLIKTDEDGRIRNQ